MLRFVQKVVQVALIPFRKSVRIPIDPHRLGLVGMLGLMLFAKCSYATEVNLGQLAAGQLFKTNWRGYPVIVYRRTPHQMEQLRLAAPNPKSTLRFLHYQQFAKAHGNPLASEIYASSEAVASSPFRSAREDLLVVLGVSTRFGCAITWQAQLQLFIDPCSQTQYDLAGRVIQPTAREQQDLLVPPHTINGDTLQLPDTSSASTPLIRFTPNIEQMPITAGEKLLEALEWQEFELVPQLLKQPGVTNYRTATGGSALHVAASKAPTNVLQQLLQAGFEVNQTTNDGISPLMLAVMYFQAENAKLLIAHGASQQARWQGKTMSLAAFLFEVYAKADAAKIEKFLNEIQSAE